MRDDRVDGWMEGGEEGGDWRGRYREETLRDEVRKLDGWMDG